MTWDSSKFDQSRLRLRDALQANEDFSYNVVVRERLPVSAPDNQEAAFIRARRTRRHFGLIGLSDVAAFLQLVAQPAMTIVGAYGPVELRPAPSAGARHPIDLLVVDPRRLTCAVYRPRENCLDTIGVNADSVKELVAAATRLLEPEEGILVWLVAQPGRTMMKYDHAESFVMFDAGALVATMSFAAQALGLSFCPLGTSGEPTISQLLRSRGKIVGLLGGVLGSRVGNEP